MYYSLHNHTDEGSNQRLIDTINTTKTLLQRSFDLGHLGCAITDHESLSAHVTAEDFIESQRNNPKLSEEEKEKWKNFKLIRGNEIYLCRNGLNESNFDKKTDKFYHFILIALNERGHEQLRELSTIAYKRSFVKDNMVRPMVYYSDIKRIIGGEQGNIIGSSACLGSQIDRMILDQEFEKLYGFIDFLDNRVFGHGNFFLELQPSKQKEQLIVNKKLINLSKELDIPAIITTDSHMLTKEDLPFQRAFLNSKDGDREVDAFYASAYLMSAREIHEYLDDNIGSIEVDKCLENTKLIGDRVQEYSLKKPFTLPFMPLHTDEISDLPYELKGNQYFEYFLKSPEQSDRIFIARVVNFMNRGDKWFPRDFWYRPESIERLSTELNYLRISSENQKMTWTKYLLQMADYIELIWEKGDTIVAPGRGSAVGEVLNYILGIIQVNPLAEKAPVKCWRFINPERASILDVDSDIESTKRNKVINVLQEHYGEFNVVRVMTKKTEASKSAILTAARGIGMDNDTASYIASMIVADRGKQRTLHETYFGDEEHDFAPNMNFRAEMDKNPKLWEIAQRIEGLVTGISSHAGGVIIYDKDITKTNSLMKLKSGDYITAYDLHQSEDLSK